MMPYLASMVLMVALVTEPSVSTGILDPGGLTRTFFIVLVIVVEFYFFRRMQMATKEELLAAVQGVVDSTAAEITRIANEIAALQAAGVDDGVSPADLDGPIASLQQVKATLDGVVFTQPVTPPVEG